MNPELLKAQEQFSSFHTTTRTSQRATKIKKKKLRPMEVLEACHLVSSFFSYSGKRNTGLSPLHTSVAHNSLKIFFLSTSFFILCNSFFVTLENLVLSLSFLFLPLLISNFVLQIKPNYVQDLELKFMMTWQRKLINFELKLQMMKNQHHQILKPLKIPFIISTDKSICFL